MTLTFDIHKGSCTHLVHLPILTSQTTIVSEKSIVLPFSHTKDFLRFLTYMGMAAILVMRPGTFEQTFVPPSHRSSI